MNCRPEHVALAALLFAACGAQNNGAQTTRVRPEQRVDPLLGKLDLNKIGELQ